MANETYVEACFKTFRKQGNIIHRETIAFITILHLTIYLKQCPRSSWSKASNALYYIFYYGWSLKNGYQPRWKAVMRVILTATCFITGSTKCNKLRRHQWLFRSQLWRQRGPVVGRWICNPEVPGSNPLPCHQMDLCLMAPDSTPQSTPCK